MFIAIVPAYNEAPRIGSVIRSLFDHVDRVVVIDDASTDNTASLACDAGAVVLSHAINRGQGASLETGHAYARGIQADYVLHFDGDGQFDVADIRPALATLQKTGADILFGSRFLDGRSAIPLSKKYIILPIGRLVNKLLFGVHLSDAHNGFRILNTSSLNNIFITQDRMAHATEIPSLAQKKGLRIVEHPVKVTYHTYGQGVGSGIQVLKDLLYSSFIK